MPATAKKHTAAGTRTANTRGKNTRKKTLVIVESPSKAHTIEGFLGSRYTVIASAGHVRDIPKSRLGVDIANNFEPQYITIRGKGDTVKKIRDEAKRADKVLLATDPDREGEAISWHLAWILELDPSSPCRVEFNEITKDAVKKAIEHPRAIDTALFNEQQARRVLDRLIGYQITEIMWEKLARKLSAGRVQSAATKLLYDREAAIESFVPEEYWTITATLRGDGKNKPFTARYAAAGERKVASQEEADKVVERTGAGPFAVSEIKEEEKARRAQPPFTTSSLQQEASRKLSFNTSRTMQVAQKLYEGIALGNRGPVGLISYMRTDSTRVSEEAQQAALTFIREKYGDDYAPATPNVYKGRAGAQDAHEAIRPTDIQNTPESVKAYLNNEEYKLYKLIYERFLASQMTDRRYTATAVTLDANGCRYRANGIRVLFKGYTKVYTEGSDTEQEKENSLPPLQIGEVLPCEGVAAEQKFTQGPDRYTEASLVRAMEENGIGRPSTYAPTISTVLARNYALRDKKQLYITDIGKTVTEWMDRNFPEIVNVEFTADMEKKLDDIGEGKREWTEVVGDFYGPFEQELIEARQREAERIPDRQSDVICEKCGATMVYKYSRGGEFLGCPNYPSCKNTKPILIPTGVKCPECGGDILVKKSRKGRTFYGCSNYPNCKFALFNKPVDKRCPQCGALLTERYGGSLLRCGNDDCGYSEKVEKAKENQDA